MFYLLVHFTGGLETEKEFFEFQSEKGLLEFVTDNFKTEGFKVHKILKEAVEYEVKYALHLQPAKRTAADKKKRDEEKKPAEPEKKIMKSKEHKNYEKGAGPKCSQCGRKIAAHNKTGVCTPCQLGKES